MLRETNVAILRYNWRVAVILSVWMGLVAAVAQPAVAPESKVKAAFLYNFAKLTEWPTNAFSTADSPLVIGVLGAEPMARALQELVEHRALHSRRVFIARLRPGDDLAKCHVVFISGSDADQVGSILRTLSHRPVLTVSDSVDFAENGGMIGLILEKQAVRFEINQTAARQAHLKISSKVLALARRIYRDPPGEEKP
jgi:hypothetical protein